MTWLRQNWRWLLALVASLGGGIAALFWYALNKRKQAEKLRSQLAVLRAVAQVKGLKADKEKRRAQLVRNTAERDKISQALADAKRRAVSATADVSKMDDLQVAVAFKELGY